jgi:hypothetical protein
MVIGGIAVIAHGVQRMTTDIDAVIRGDAVSVHALIDVLRRHQIVPRIENAEAFAATNLVLLTRHRPTDVDLDLSLGWTAFEHEALAARTSTRFGKTAVPMAGVDELLVFKAIAGRPRDVDDAVALLTLYPGIDMTRVHDRVAALAEAAEAPELTAGLEQVLRAAASTPLLRTSAAKKPPGRGAPRASAAASTHRSTQRRPTRKQVVRRPKKQRR